MKKRNEYPQSAKNSRSSAPDRERKNDPRSSNVPSSRSEGPRNRFGEPGNSGPFKPKKKITERLFNKPTLKKSSFKKMAFDSSTGRNRFGEEPSPRRVEADSERRDDAQRSDARRSDARHDDARPFNRDGRSPRPRTQSRSFDNPKGDFRPRREEGNSDRPSRSGDDRRSDAPRFDRNERPARRDDRGSDMPRGDFRPRREEGNSDRPSRSGDDLRRDNARSFNRDGRSPRPRTQSRSFDNPKGDFRPRREEGNSDRPSRSGDDRRSDAPRFDRNERPARRDDRGSDKPREEFRPRREDDRRSERPMGDVSPRRLETRPDRETDSRGKESTTDGENRRVGKFSKPPRYDFSDYENKKSRVKKHSDDDVLRLNRYIANAGICSRREADELIESGQIMVNGKVITEMGYKVKRSDVIKYGKNVLNPEKMVYLLINKPKDYITTTEDPEERKTVMDLVEGACEERIYPVGRLDRNTTGLLLLTNDGELAEKLTHPSGNIRKIYQAELDKPITTEDFEAMQKGFELEDGFIRPDDISIVTPDAMVIGLEIHSGKNRIVRRMFENFGYEVKKLDRTVFAGLNKKELPRGKWRFLSEKEVIKLKFMM